MSKFLKRMSIVVLKIVVIISTGAQFQLTQMVQARESNVEKTMKFLLI